MLLEIHGIFKTNIISICQIILISAAPVI